MVTHRNAADSPGGKATVLLEWTLGIPRLLLKGVETKHGIVNAWIQLLPIVTSVKVDNITAVVVVLVLLVAVTLAVAVAPELGHR